MHDGSPPDRDSVLRYCTSGGIANPLRDPAIRPLDLSAADRRDLVAFLESLTGTLARERRAARARRG